ncbi:hypothetical protein, partial [Klebsiella pneumoniae]|uniref:hypothetical protein n=1 Tax=Klebsiella pneumoniae TaxID=573 RepID=UPI001C8BCE24
YPSGGHGRRGLQSTLSFLDGKSLEPHYLKILKEGANKRGNSSRLTQSFHFFMFEPIFSPVNALNQPI